MSHILHTAFSLGVIFYISKYFLTLSPGGSSKSPSAKADETTVKLASLAIRSRNPDDAAPKAMLHCLGKMAAVFEVRRQPSARDWVAAGGSVMVNITQRMHWEVEMTDNKGPE